MMPNPTAGKRRNDTLPSGFVRYEHDLAALAFQGMKLEKTPQLDFGSQYETDTLDLWFSGYAGHIDDFILFRYPAPGVHDGRSGAML